MASSDAISPASLAHAAPRGHRAAVIASFLGWTLDAFDFFLVVFSLTAIAKDFAALAEALGFPDDAVVTIPVSALVGDNVVERSERTPWYDGPTLLGHLEQLGTDVGDAGG